MSPQELHVNTSTGYGPRSRLHPHSPRSNLCSRRVGHNNLQCGTPSLLPPSLPSLSLPSRTNNHQGYTRFSTFSDLSASTVEDWDTCFAVNVKAQLHLMKAALPTFNSKVSNPEGGVFIITSSIAGRNTGGSSMPYSVTKAAQLHLMRCLASTQGPAVRINAVLPGWLDTEWVRFLLFGVRELGKGRG